MNSELTKYLQTRPIAPILNESKEKKKIKAMKMMCIVDFFMDKNGFYEKMKKYPKLKHQLMNFHSYDSFRYYCCRVNSGIGEFVLQCKFCELIGPYALIMSHMVMNHNSHVSHTLCAFCKRKDLSSHIKIDTLNHCYEEYLHKNKIAVDEDIINIVTEFYGVLKNLAGELGVIIWRKATFSGEGYRKSENVNRKIDGFPRKCITSVQKVSPKKVNSQKLRQYFKMAISKIVDGNGNILRPETTETKISDEIVVISSDHEDEEGENYAANCKSPQVKKEQVPIESEKQTRSTDLISDVTNNIANTNASEASVSAADQQMSILSQAEAFGQHVTNRLLNIRDERKRRKLELHIQSAIVRIEGEDFADDEHRKKTI